MDNYTITVDPGVGMPERRSNKGSSAYVQHRDPLLALQPGETFFIPAEKIVDTNGLYLYARRIGVDLRRSFVKNDEVYQKPGVRFQRMTDEEAATRQAQMAERKPSTRGKKKQPPVDTFDL